MAAEPAPQINLDYLLEVARRVKAARGYAGLSQRQLGAELGVDAGTVKRWEKGDVQLAKRLDTIARVCKLPLPFFTVDFDRLEELEAAPSDDGDQQATLRTLNERLANVEADLAELAARERTRTTADDETNPGQGRPGPP